MEVSFGLVMRKKRESDEAYEAQWRWCILDEESSVLGKIGRRDRQRSREKILRGEVLRVAKRGTGATRP